MFTPREILIEVDFVNDYIVEFGNQLDYAPSGTNSKPKKRELKPELKEKFLQVVDPFWHSEKDQLVFFQYFSDGQYFCQRRKLKYDFQTESTYFQDYKFTGGSPSQVQEFYESCSALREVAQEIKNLDVEAKVKEIDKEVLFYEQRYYKIRRMRESLLNNTDFRVLPDVEEKFPGEKDMWIAWRKHVREKSLIPPSDPMFHDENGVPSGLKFFKYSYDFKFPVDPKIYYRMYPDGKLEDGVTDAPPFMDPDDPNQWVRQEVEASTDFYTVNEKNMYNLSGRGVPAQRKIKKNVLDLMKELAVDDIIPVDWDRYFTDESQLS